MNNNFKSVLLNTTSASEFTLQLTGKSSSATSDLFNFTLLAKKKKGVQDKIAWRCMSRTEQNNGTMHVQYFSTSARRHIPCGNCLSSVFKYKYLICCSQAGVLRHGEGRASGQTILHMASHSLTSGLDRNGLFPLLQPKPHCLSAVLININQM